MIRRVGLVSALVGLGLAASASPASAAVTLGQTGNPSAVCNSDAYIAQTATGGLPPYAVPAGYGVITSWSFQGTSFIGGPGSGKFLVWRPTGVGNQYTLIHKSPMESFTTGSATTFPVRFPVQPNDVLGMVASPFCLAFTGVPGDVARYVETAIEPAEGSTQDLNQSITSERILVSARVETDLDHDNFGDETQDQCPTNATTQGPCPVSPAASVTGQRAAALKKCKKKAKQKHWTKKQLKKCKKKANALPV
jgi:hypothetical protein